MPNLKGSLLVIDDEPEILESLRALLTLEGVALAINPEFNFVEAAMPFAQRLVFKEAGASVRHALLKEVFSEGKFQPQKAINLIRSASRLTL